MASLVYVEGLPAWYSHGDLSRLFESAGAVASAYIIKAGQEAPERRLVCGVVAMASREEATQAVALLNGRECCGGRLLVEPLAEYVLTSSETCRRYHSRLTARWRRWPRRPRRCG
ncbi:RNA recognition motif domain-containing protein [Candidatus Nitrospira bockiana]